MTDLHMGDGMAYGSAAARARVRWVVRERGEADGYGPDAWHDPDALEALGDRIATLFAHVHAAEYRLLVMIEEFDRRKGWEPAGHRSCAEWLSFRTGIDLGAARERVRAARALADLPQTSAAMARGELSFAKVRAVTRVATPESEAELVDFARPATVAQTERFVRAWRKGDRADDAALERERHRSRRLVVRPDGEGMYEVRGRVDPEVGALLMRALEMAAGAQYRKTRRSQAMKATQRWADALGLLAERAMAVGFGGEDVSAETPDGEEEDASGGCPDAPVSGSRAERYQVLLHVDAATLSADGEPGRSHLEDGTRVSAETSRRLACDAAVVTVGRGADGSVLDVGRRTRTVPPALRRALEVRDRGCRFPGCGLRFTDAHHVRHWADGGETRLDNLVLLCRFHHRLVHEEGFSVEWREDGRPGPLFRDARGRQLNDWPTPSRLIGDPAAALVRAHVAAGIDPDGLTASARWKGEADVPWGAYVRVLEALEGEGEGHAPSPPDPMGTGRDATRAPGPTR